MSSLAIHRHAHCSHPTNKGTGRIKTAATCISSWSTSRGETCSRSFHAVRGIVAPCLPQHGTGEIDVRAHLSFHWEALRFVAAQKASAVKGGAVLLHRARLRHPVPARPFHRLSRPQAGKRSHRKHWAHQAGGFRIQQNREDEVPPFIP